MVWESNIIKQPKLGIHQKPRRVRLRRPGMDGRIAGFEAAKAACGVGVRQVEISWRYTQLQTNIEHHRT